MKGEETLDLLGALHYVLGGLLTAGSLVMIAELFGFLWLARSGDGGGTGSDAWLFGILLLLFNSGWIFGALTIAAGRKLRARMSLAFCLVMAGAECLFMPLGTILGVFTIITLTQEPVRALFDKPTADPLR